MSIMSNRATYALDVQTTQSIKQLARTWGVSQAEVVRRSVRLAVEHKSAAALSPADVVAHYATKSLPRTKVQTRRAVDASRALRHQDDARRQRNHA